MRKIGVVTTSRADYSHLFWVLKAIQEHADLSLSLYVSGAHLSDSFGQSVEQIKRDGFPITAEIPCLSQDDSDFGMAETLGEATRGFARTLGADRPDLLLLIADRYEMLAPATIATTLRIPIAHIEGGEVSLGAIDDPIRHCITKLSHFHFVPHESAARRVRALGEEAWRITITGAPSLDHITKSSLPSFNHLNHPDIQRLPEDSTLAIFHPLTTAKDTLRETAEFFEALEQIPRPVAFCFPNADAGGRFIIKRAQQFAAKHGTPIYINLEPLHYLSLLREVSVLIGNSSSGIMESASFKVPTVNVGRRQEGRERAMNIIDTPADTEAILNAWKLANSDSFRSSLQNLKNPYGDGQAAERIVKVLAQSPLDEAVRIKAALMPVEVQ